MGCRPAGIAIADKYSVDDRRVTFAGLGASYDPGKWFVMGEWARFKTNSILGTKSALYASGGYRFGKVTQPVQLLAEVAVLRELLFDVGDTRLDLFNDGADVRNLCHVSPSVDGSMQTLRQEHRSR